MSNLTCPINPTKSQTYSVCQVKIKKEKENNNYLILNPPKIKTRTVKSLGNFHSPYWWLKNSSINELRVVNKYEDRFPWYALIIVNLLHISYVYIIKDTFMVYMDLSSIWFDPMYWIRFLILLRRTKEKDLTK